MSVRHQLWRGNFFLFFFVLYADSCRFALNKFNGARTPTIATDFLSRKMMIHDTEIFVQVWDTVGQERYSASSVGGAFFRGAHGALLVYDVNDEKSIEQVEQWRDECVSRQGNSDFFPIVVIGNKTDIRDNNTPVDERIDQSGILSWCRDNSFGHIETSAKDGVGVEAAMTVVAALALEAQRNNDRSNNHSHSSGSKQRQQSTNGRNSNNGKVDLSSRYEKQSSGCSGGSCT